MLTLILIALAALALILTLLALTRSAPLPDYADPDVEDVPLEQFLDESTG